MIPVRVKAGLWSAAVAALLGCGNAAPYPDETTTTPGKSSDDSEPLDASIEVVETCDPGVGFQGTQRFEFSVEKVIRIGGCRYLALESNRTDRSRAHILSQDGTVAQIFEFDFRLYNVMEADGDTLIFSGSEPAGTDGDTAGVVLATDLSGTLLWEYRDNRFNFVSTVGPIFDGELAVLGPTVVPEYANQEIVAVIDAQHELVRVSQIPPMLLQSDGYSSHSPLVSKASFTLPDNRLITCGNGTASGNGIFGDPLPTASAGFVATYAVDEGWVWRYRPLATDFRECSVGRCILSSGGDHLIVSAWLEDETATLTDNRDVRLISLSFDGEVIEEAGYSIPGKRSYPRDLRLLPDGSVAVAGRVWEDGQEAPFLMQIGPDGEMLWFKLFEIDGFAQDMAVSYDGGFIVVGYSYGEDEGFLIGTNAKGQW